MASTTVQVIDLCTCTTPQALASAIRDSLSTAGFLFITHHGLEQQVGELFEISGKDSVRVIRNRLSLKSILSNQRISSQTRQRRRSRRRLM